MVQSSSVKQSSMLLPSELLLTNTSSQWLLLISPLLQQLAGKWSLKKNHGLHVMDRLGEHLSRRPCARCSEATQPRCRSKDAAYYVMWVKTIAFIS